MLVIGLYVGFVSVSDFFCLTVLSPVDKATNPLNRETDWESIQLFCDQLSNEPEGCVNNSIIFKLKCAQKGSFHMECVFAFYCTDLHCFF